MSHAPVHDWLEGDRTPYPGAIPWSERLPVGQPYEAGIYLNDGTGRPLLPERLDEVRLSLYDEVTFRTVNGQQDVDVLGQVAPDGRLALLLSPQDTTPMDGSKQARHVAFLEFTWDGGECDGFVEIVFTLGLEGP